ncbi:hypothetical protein BDZ90DRAFT_246826 [Jaminaea rosea]|uniref:Macrofage activating glyco protein n=1 Tax=Jaminaea rosea TaxID=1569628 RepID=A0A316UL83_9BASI|nr:hypothetical protein BDZ90DRAFT_246826 [Jaminaea rosea]PWN26027.1 hypothetical protein BDZ90DRAFT_246826 [Jaminaea rosea]
MVHSSLSIIATAITLGAALRGASAQTGNPSAASGQSFNQPTKSWEQWQPKPTYAYSALPDRYMGDDRGKPTESGYQWDQSGYNRCLQADGSWNANATCQTAWINAVDDWCIWGPPVAGTEVGSYERVAVAYCTKGNHGTRLIPEGTLTGVHFVKTKDYVQVTGQGNFTNIGIPEGDAGGEMDPHGEDDLMNPIGGVVYSTVVPGHEGTPYQLGEWTNFMSWNQFCLRACWGTNARAQCQHIYDVLGCTWNIPANYGEGFESCEGDIAMIQGVYDGSTFYQGQPNTPAPHPAPSSSRCSSMSSVGNGGLLLAASLQTSSSAAPASSSAAAGSSSGMQTVGRQTGASSGANAAATGSSRDNASSGAASTMVVGAAAGIVALVGAAMVL